MSTTPSSWPHRLPTFVAALLLMTGVAVALVWGTRALENRNAWVEHTYQVIEKLEAYEADLYAAEAGARGFRLTGHPALEAQFRESDQRARSGLDELVALSRDNPVQNRRSLELRTITVAHLTELERLARVQHERGMQAARDETRIDASVQRGARVRQLSSEFRAQEIRLLDERRQASTSQSRLLTGFAIGGLLSSLAVFSLLMVGLSRENRRALRLERESREALARLEQASAVADRLSEQRRELGAYAGMLQSCRNLDEALELTSHSMERLLPHVGGRLYLSRMSSDFLETAAIFGHEPISNSDTIRADDCWALRRGQPHRADATGMRCAHLDPGTAMGSHATLCIPLVAQGETLGVLHACGEADDGPSHEAILVESVGEQLAMAMANLRLRETLRVQSLRDPLTGLYNRRYLEENLARELQRCERKGLPLSVLMLDVDHFKRFNDQHGHAAGDAILAHVGRVLREHTRGEDIACRYGGEEFTIVLPETDVATALVRAEALRVAVGSGTIMHLGKTLGPITISVGAATAPDDGGTAQVLLEVADAALYRAKAEGRDRVIHARRA